MRVGMKLKLIDRLTLSKKNFLRQGYKTIGPIVMISIAIILYILIAAFVSSARDGVNDHLMENEQLRVIEVLNGHETVLTYDDVSMIDKIDGVQKAFPKELTTVYLLDGLQGENTALVGVPDDVLDDIVGTSLRFENRNDLIIQTDLEYLDYLSDGDTVNIEYTVMLSEGEGITDTVEANVIGKLDEKLELYGYIGNFSITTLDFVMDLNARLFNLPVEEYVTIYSPESITVLVEDVNQVVPVAELIGDKGFMTSYALNSAQELPLFAKSVMYIGGIVVLLLLIFAGISISMILTQSIKSRYREIGIMKSIGFNKGHISFIFLTEVFFMCFIAFIIGVLISFILVFVINQVIVNQSAQTVLYFNIKISHVILSFILSILVGLMSSFKIITRATKMAPVKYLERD